MKPHITIDGKFAWSCKGDGIERWASTPKTAYEMWLYAIESRVKYA